MSRATLSVTYRVEELDCAVEENELRAALGPLTGVRELDFDLVARRITVHHDLADTATIEDAIRAAGMRPKRIVATIDGTQDRSLSRRAIAQIVVGGVLALGSEGLVLAGQRERSAPVAVMAIAAIAVGGRDTLRKGWQAALHRRLTMALLMSVAVIGAVAIGQWPEAAVVIWLFGVAELIEAMSLERARNAIRSLVKLAPESALVLNGDEGWESRPAGEVRLGDTILVKPGERIPLDGTVTSGASTVDQAPITGESIPVTKEIGDPLFAGTINQQGTLQYVVTAAKGEGTLDRIARSIQGAQAAKAPSQRFVDRFAAVYTPAIFAIAVGVAAIPPIFGTGEWRSWFYKALVLLVLACPCALVISTPVTIVAGLGGAARRGILIKGGAHLEGARHITAVALDKTGTLTHGKPVLVDTVALGIERERALRIAASLDTLSEHPVAHAIVSAHDGKVETVVDFRAIPGRGVSGVVDGVCYRLGNHRLAEETGICNAALEAVLEGFKVDAKTAVVLMTETTALAVFAVADTIRPEAAEAVADLRALHVKAIMLTGDNQRTANAVARQVAIVDARGDLLPDDKLRIVNDFRAAGERVAMIGDGVNDAPALAAADLGIAMGAAGTDTAIETADIALMDDDPRKLAEMIRISQHTTHVLWQNIAVALGVKVVFFTLTLAGTASLWVAVLADMGASLVVIANGLRLLRRPSHRRRPSSG